jgi:hypothetical protein
MMSRTKRDGFEIRPTPGGEYVFANDGGETRLIASRKMGWNQYNEGDHACQPSAKRYNTGVVLRMIYDSYYCFVD